MKKMALVLAACILMPAHAALNARLGTSLPDDHPLTLGARDFAERLAQKSGGDIKVTVYANGILGNDVDMTAMVQGGTLDFTTPSTATLASLDDDFTLVSLPFVFADKQAAFAALDGEFGKNLLGKLPTHGLHGLAFYDHGFRQITNSRRAIKSLEDVGGLKIRVMQNRMFVDLFSTLEANPVPMPVNELFTALETRTVDAQENPEIVILAKRFYEVQPYLTVTNHAYDTQVLITGERFMAKLEAQQQAWVREAAQESMQHQRDLAEKLNRKARADMAKSVSVNELDAAEMARFRAKVAPLLDNYRERAEALGLRLEN